MPERSKKLQSTEKLHFLCLDDRQSLEIVLRSIYEENRLDIELLNASIGRIAGATTAYARAIAVNGCIFYIGAGTSGRLGFVDAAEVPTTFGIAPDRVQVIFPGNIVDISAETDSCEDDAAAGRRAVAEHDVGPRDLAIGITASGETPFVIGAIQEAKAHGATTAGIISNPGTTLEQLVDLPIVVATGPELIAGSTRLKAGTVQKVILNMLSTAAMVSLGKVYDGFMVGLRANNKKLRRRAVRTLTALTGQETDVVEHTLAAADYEVDTALVMLTGNITHAEAKRLLQKYQGNVRRILETLEHGTTGRK